MSKTAVAMKNVSMTFDGVQVLHGVNLSIVPGEIHGLVGENGSGKSTLVKILGGIYKPDSGSEVHLHDQPVPMPVRDPQEYGLAIVHQDLALVQSMSVADNTGVSTSYERRLMTIASAGGRSCCVRSGPPPGGSVMVACWACAW